MTKNNIKKNVLISTLGGYFVALSNFTLNLLLIRNLSPELYGLFSYIINQSRRALRLLDFSFIELILISKKRGLELTGLYETFLFHSIIRFVIVFIVGFFAAWYSDNLATISVIGFLLIYTNARYFYVFGVVHFYEVYFNTKIAQFFYTLSSIILLLAVFISSYLLPTTLYNFALVMCLASLLVIFLISIMLYRKSDIGIPRISMQVLSALKEHSLFLQLPILFSVITKFIQDTLIITEQSIQIFAFYSISLLLGSVAVIGARGTIRPLAPYLWSLDGHPIKPYVYMGVLLYFIGIVLSLSVSFFEDIFLLINKDYAGIGIYLSLGILLAISMAYSQIISTFIIGAGLIKNLSIVNSITIVLTLLLTLLAYFFLDSKFFAINLLIIDILLTNINIITITILYKFKLRIISE